MLVNIEDIKNMLQINSVSMDTYCLDGGTPNDCPCIEKKQGCLSVYYSDRGEMYNRQIFNDEHKACIEFLKVFLQNKIKKTAYSREFSTGNLYLKKADEGFYLFNVVNIVPDIDLPIVEISLFRCIDDVIENTNVRKTYKVSFSTSYARELFNSSLLVNNILGKRDSLDPDTTEYDDIPFIENDFEFKDIIK